MKSDKSSITKLVQGAHDPNRVNVFVDHKYAFSLSAEEVIKRGLKNGMELAASVIHELQSVSGEEKVFGKIVNFLSYRPRSIKEVKDRLYKYLGKDESETVAAVMAKLDRLGYLNDREFAKWFVQSRVANRPRSARHVSSELYAKGISKEIIAETVRDESDDRTMIRAAIAKKKSMDKKKLIAYLARQGYAWELIKDELGEYQEQE